MLKFLEQKLVPALYYLYILSVFVSIALVNILGLLVFALIIGLRIYRYYKFKEEFVPKNPLNNIILLIFMVEVLSILTSPFLSTAIKPWWWYVIKNRQILLFFLHLIVLSYYVDYKNVLKFILYVSPIFAVLALYDSISGSYVLKLHFVNNFHWPPSIIGGAYKGYINYAFIHNMIVFTIIPFIFIAKDKTTKILLSSIVLFEIFCIIMSGSRSAILSITGAIIGETLVFYFIKEKYWKYSLSLMIVVIISVSAAVLYIPRLRGRFQQTKTNITKAGDDNRFTLWKINIAMFKDYPILGIGSFINADKDLLLKYREKAGVSKKYIRFLSIYEKPMYHAHNTYLQFLSGTGLIGFSLFIIFIIQLIRILLYLVSNYVNISNKYDLFLLVGLVGVLGASFGISLTDILFFKVVYDNLVMLAIALLTYLYLKYSQLSRTQD